MNLRKTSKAKCAWIERLKTVTDCIADWSESGSDRFDAVTSVAANLVKLALQYNSAVRDLLHRRPVASTLQKDTTCHGLVPLRCLDEHPEWRMRLTDQMAERVGPRLALIIRPVAAQLLSTARSFSYLDLWRYRVDVEPTAFIFQRCC